MPDVQNEVKPAQPAEDKSAKPLQAELWNKDHLNTLQDVQRQPLGKVGEAPSFPTGDLLTQQGLLTKNLEKDLHDLQHALENTQKELIELQKKSNSGLYELELSRRTLTENPYKWLSAGSGLALMSKSPGLGSLPLAGVATMQGFDDFKSLREQTTLAGRTKYSLGLLSDTAAGAGALGFLTESVPMRYKLPLLAGGMLVRAAIDFIPDSKHK